MADLKISALTAAGSVDPDDLLASVDVSDTTMNASGTTKKTTRELLQTYNAGTLTTDKKVLDLSATWNAAGVTFTGVKFNVTNTASASGSKVFDFQIGGSTQLALTATGLGVGVAAPTSKLSVTGTTTSLAQFTGPEYSQVRHSDGTRVFYTQVYNNLAQVGTESSTPIAFVTNNTEKMRLDASGNLGLGVTPSAWLSTLRALQVGTAALVGSSATGGSTLSHNTYYDGSNWIYFRSTFASKLEYDTSFRWYIAPTGTAGNAISFTQAMTLDASGLLTVGNTSPAGSSQITAYGASNGQIAVQNSTNWSRLLQNAGDLYIDNGVGGSSGNIIFRQGSGTTERLRIDSSGNVGIGTTLPSTYGRLAVMSTGSPATGYAAILSGAPVYGAGFESTLYLGAYRTDILNNAQVAGYRFKTQTSDQYSAYFAIEAASSATGANAPPTTYTERLRIDASGNLLVGTTTAVTSNGTNLNLYGASASNLSLQNATSGTGNNNGFQLILDGIDTYVQNRENGSLIFATNNTERLRLTNAGLLTFGGVTSSFPALKRSSTTLQVRLADDSGDAPFSSGRATIDTLTVGRGGATSVATNTAVGFEVLNSASLTGESNAGVGYHALRVNTTGAFNNAVGIYALVANTTGSYNNAMGLSALGANTTASFNTAIGGGALRYFNTSNNVAVGVEAVRGSTTVANNTGASLVGVGYQALLANTSGSSNTAVGYRALVANTTGANNSAVGFESLGFNTTGQYNVAFGMYAFASGTTASNNVAVGYDSLALFSTNNNVAVGFRALKGGSATVANNTGANNIGIGYQAGDAITTGSNNIVIGYDIDPDSATGSSQINIGDRYFHDRIRLLERTSDPAKPAEGNMIVWMSDGTGLGDDGDVIIASTAGGVTNYAILFDHSAGTVWP